MDQPVEDPPILGSVTKKQYFTLPAWHSGELKSGLNCSGRAFYALHRDPKRKRVVTDAMRQGSLVDCILTQPDRFEETYMVLPSDLPSRPTAKQLTTGEDSRPGTKARAAWEDAQAREREWIAFQEESKGRELISAAWMENAQRIYDVAMADPDIGPLFRDRLPSTQEGWLWIDKQGHVCAYLPDLETQAGGLWDLKKTIDTAPRPASAVAYKRAFDLQLAHYGLGYENQHKQPPDHYGIIFFDWDEPHETLVMDADEDFIAMGHRRRQRAFERIHEWDASGVYPTHPRSVLSPPPWEKPGGRTTEPLPEIELF
jgi:hypothetical protein